MNLVGNTFVIHPIQPGEENAILDVYRQCEDFLALGPVPTASMEMVEADLEHSRQDRGVFCGIYDPRSGVMMGIIDVVPAGWEGDPQCAFLSLLMISAPHRGRGLGAEVVQLVEGELVRNQKVNRMESGVQVNNPAGIRFWQRMGYQIVSGPRDLPDGTTAYALEKMLVTDGD